MPAALPHAAATLNAPLLPQRPLRVAVVTETWPPEVNGVALTLARTVEGLAARGHAVMVVRPRQPADANPNASPQVSPHVSPSAVWQQLLVPGLKIPRYPQMTMGLPARGLLFRQWSARRPDVVHIATEGPLGWSALAAATALGLPVTSDFRTNFQAYSRHYGLGRLAGPIMGYLRWFHNRTQATMVPTEALRSTLADSGFRNLQVVGRGVDTALFSPGRRSAALRQRWGAGDDTRVVAFVGRLAPEKNLETLVAAFEAVRKARPDSRLLLVGDGPSRRALQARCPDAVFAGQRTGVDLAAHYASADLFVFPSLTETYGNVTPEAMASGLPVVAFDHAAAALLIHSGRDGWLAPVNSPAALVAHAVALAIDRDRARTMGQLARQSVLPHGWDRIIGQIETSMARACLPLPASRMPPMLARPSSP